MNAPSWEYFSAFDQTRRIYIMQIKADGTHTHVAKIDMYSVKTKSSMISAMVIQYQSIHGNSYVTLNAYCI